MRFFSHCCTVASRLLLYIIHLSDKVSGSKKTLKEFLKEYAKDTVLKAEYKKSDKEELLKDFKRKKECVPAKVTNVSISKSVMLKMQRVTTLVCLYCFLDKTNFLPPLSAGISTTRTGPKLHSFFVVAIFPRLFPLVRLRQRVPRDGWKMQKLGTTSRTVSPISLRGL